MKRAYPNFAPDHAEPVYNLNKWLDAMRQIYAQVHFGAKEQDALKAITSSWSDTERFDFSGWLKYYQSGDQLKYKKAQLYMPDNIPSYFLPSKIDNSRMPSQIVEDPSEIVNRDNQERLDKATKRQAMEEQRKKIIGRLHAAIKHLTSPEGHALAGAEFEHLLNSMYELLKQFQTVNKVSLSNQLWTDLLIRQGAKLAKVGASKSSALMYKLAQNMQGSPSINESALPIASKSGDGVSGTLENDNPAPATLNAQLPQETDEDDALSELSKNLETAGITDDNSIEDEELEVTLDPEDEELLAEAQVAPTPPVPSAVPTSNISPVVPTSVPADLDVELPATQPLSTEAPTENLEVELPGDSNVDEKLEAALDGVKVQDAIDKFESVLLVFTSGQIVRELSMGDLILNKLRMSPLFKEVPEIMQKFFEASGYISSRLESVISQLRGTIDQSSIDVKHLSIEQATPHSEEADRARQFIKDRKDKDKARKERRKQMENDAIDTESAEPIAAPSPPPVQAPAAEVAQVPTQIV